MNAKHPVYAIALAITAACAADAADRFTFNGREITVPAPAPGYLRVTSETPALMRQLRQLDDPYNDTIAWYISEADAAVARAGGTPDLDRAFNLKVSKDLRDVSLGRSDFAVLKREARNQHRQAMEAVKSALAEQTGSISDAVSREFDVDVAMQISDILPLEPHHETEDQISMSTYSTLGISGGGVTESIVTATTSTLVNANGTVLFLYSNAPREDLEWTRDVSREWANAILGLNGKAGRNSSAGDSFDWEKVLRMTIAGCIGGGLFMFVSGLIKRSRDSRTGR